MLKNTRILVTGGAGYIGSHTLRLLGEKGADILVVDNLSSGYREFITYGELKKVDIGNLSAMKETLSSFRPRIVIHFAAFIQAEESVRNPMKYYLNNLSKTIMLLQAMQEAGVELFIFSSSAAVYGLTDTVPIPEGAPFRPANPYGRSKAAVETVLQDLSNAGAIRFVSLRYFNASGASIDARLGERHRPETHLIPLLLKTAKGELPSFTIYGDDYPTPDGTCIRDYIHVLDLAEAHVLAAEYLLSGADSAVFNCGYGRGYSVREVVDVVKKVTGVDFPVNIGPRRPGDPPVLIADPARIKQTLGWKPRYDDLEFIVKTAWEWERKESSQ